METWRQDRDSFVTQEAASGALLVDRLAARAWPAASVHLVDGWLLRHTPGVQRRRSNSALPFARDLPSESLLRAVEGYYTRCGGRALIQVSPAELHARLDERLAARGYRLESPTEVLTAPVEAVQDGARARPGLEVTVSAEPTGDWLTTWAEIEQRPDAAATRRLVLPQLAGRAGYALARTGGRSVGVALGVCEGGWAGVYCMATRPEERCRGAGRAVLEALSSWAARRGARELYLQVQTANVPARALYEASGFRRAYGYHYRAGPSGSA